MLGGGIFTTQSKVLPGTYMNFVNASSSGSTVSDRGVVAICLDLGKAEETVIEVTKSEFETNCKTIFGKEYNSEEMLPLREIFCHASKVLVYDSDNDHSAGFLDAIEPYDFNVVCCAVAESSCIDQVKEWRDTSGKKCQVVVYNYTKPDHEGVINVVSTPTNEGVNANSLIYWVAGAMAGCKINESCTNMLYDGELTVNTKKTQTELQNYINEGKIAFHNVYGEVRLLEDVNSLTTTTANKGEDFKYNQTIRVIDQIANDIAKLFNTKYLGRIPNNESGRVSLWADIVAHHRKLEAIGAIEAFDANSLTVEQGSTKKAVVINESITVANAMSQLYMTVVIQ